MQKVNRIGEIISHYKIIDFLGGGGMGKVYKAEDLKLKRTVALKFLPVDLTLDEQAKSRFMHEARAASALDHPRIGVIHEIDETEDGEMFIAMACYEGQTLKAKMEQESLSTEESINFIVQIANGLAKAHEEGIVHRDIKPANIIITEEGFIKIVDFGLAKLGGATRITKAGTSMGTPAYMSPQQVRGHDIDHKSDIWSLGVILYELLTKNLPFEGDYDMALLYAIVHEDPTPISQYNPNVPSELEQIVYKAISKNDTDRYTSIQEMLNDLKECQMRLSQNTDAVNTIVLNQEITSKVSDRREEVLADNLNEQQTIPLVNQAKTKRFSSKLRFMLPVALFLILTIFVLVKFTNIFTLSQTDFGYLKITSNPSGAMIALNGDATGESTPSVIGPLEQSTYQVSLSLAGFENWSGSFTVKENDTLFVSKQLSALVAEQSEEVLPIKKAAFGNLFIRSEPEGAQIYLDGQSTSKTTPARLHNIKSGKHVVQLKHKDHQLVRKTVTISENQTTEVSEILPSIMGGLFIDSNPRGALVYLDDKPTNQKTPHSFSSLSAGKHVVRLVLDDYVDHETQVIINPKEEQKINPRLIAKPEGTLRVSAVILKDNSETFAVANIYINGENFGQTPNSFALKSGTYTVTAKLFGHEAKTTEHKVTIQGGKEEIIKFEFVKKW